MSDASQPNILFIMADQFRWDFLGAESAEFVRTPNLDRIAEQGIRFRQTITNCPICAPARIGLATGQQPERYGALDNASYLPRSATTYYQLLRDHGYRVGCVGKLDLAKPSSYLGHLGQRPCVYGWGFTHPYECEGKVHAGGRISPQGPYGFYLQDQGLYEAFHKDYRMRIDRGGIQGAYHDSVLPTEAFEDAYIGRHAAQWLSEVPEDFPWHYFVSFVGPHDPFDPPTEYADRYRTTSMPPAIGDTMEHKPGYAKDRVVGLGADEIEVARRQYCAAVEVIDDQVGMMMDALEARGMLANTILIFSSDHGEMLGDHGIFMKEVPYEASVRVPLLIAGPGVEGGRVSEALVELIDLNPTICDLAGLPPQERIDARSLLPVLRCDAENQREDAVSSFRSFRLIRTDRYKYIQNYNDVDELYDLGEDPDELINIVDAEPDVAQELYRRMRLRYMEGQWRR